MIAYRRGTTEIAIIGLGSLFPVARSTGEFWDNVVRGVDCIGDVPETHWSVADYYDPDPTVPDKTYCKRGGFLPQVPFDPMEFGMPPSTLEFVDVLQTLSLLVAKQTLADAGGVDAAWHDRWRSGVVLGVTGANSIMQPLSARLQTPVVKEVVRSYGLTERDAEEIAARFAQAYVPWEENCFPGMLANVVAGRIANRFDLGGLNCTVDAACASSLAAVRLAVAELESGRADLMISGGCDADNTILGYMCFSKTPALSRSGRIRPFDTDGDGTLIGEGIGMLALRRLADAERDGNRIYAVLRGIGAASDGRHKSIYAPRGEGQILALDRAYDDARFGPEQVGLVEAHGTGTPVGDRTELDALRTVYTKAGVPPQTVALGSVKSQIGHTKGAAGAAGLIKLALSLYHKVLPPTINVDRPREALKLGQSPFYVNTRARPWIAEPGRPVRRAAISSFGFGGSNLHCVLEEHPARPAPRHRTARVYLWHAATPALLEAALSGPPTGGSAPVDHPRLAVVAAGEDELHRLAAGARTRLRSGAAAAGFGSPQGVYYRAHGRETGKVVALFAGQGSQYPDMGASAALAVREIAAAFDAAAGGFAGAEPLARVVFPPSAFEESTRRAQEAALRRTDYAQPAIGALSVGQYRYLAHSGFTPDAAVGHSFGELTALWAAGCFSDADLHRLARVRGSAMAARPGGHDDPGTMAVVRAGEDRVTALLTGWPAVAVCNVNAPAQVVVGGSTDPVRAFIRHCGTVGVEAHELPVAAAFHTAHVAHAMHEFAETLAGTAFAEPAFPVYANTAGADYRGDEEDRRRALAEQITRPVRFADRLTQLYDEGYRVFAEFGPRSVLAGLVQATLGDRAGVVAVSADPGPGHDGDRGLHRFVARLAVLGLLPRGDFAPVANLSDVDLRPRGMAISMNGVNHVPDQRRQQYREALAGGGPAGSPGRPAGSPGGLAGEHLALHREYLASQLRVSERIAVLLETEANNGMRDQVVTGIAAVAEFATTVGRAHAQAADVLRSLAYLDTGLPVPPTALAPAIEPAPRPAIEPAPPPAPAAIPSPSIMDTSVIVTAPSPAPAPGTPTAARPAEDVVRTALLDIVSARTGYPVEIIDVHMEIEADLGIDSIKRVEIMGALRERFPETGTATAEALAELRTLDDIAAFVMASPQTGPGDGGRPKAESGPGVTRRYACPVPLAPVETLARAYRENRVAMLAGPVSGTLDALDAALVAQGWTTHRGSVPPDSLNALDLVVHLPGHPADTAGAIRILRDALLLAARSQPLLQTASREGRAAFVTLARPDPDNTGLAPAMLTGLTGLVDTLALEAPTLFCRAVAVDPAVDDQTCAALVLAELDDARPGPSLARYDRTSRRFGVAPVEAGPPAPGGPAEVEVPPLSDRDLLVVTGGGHGITAACAIALARTHRPGMLLLGRTPLDDRLAWAATVPAGALRGAIADRLSRPTPAKVEREHRTALAQREIAATLEAIAETGAEVRYLAVDVTDREAVRAALAPYADRVTGLVHGAGVLADRLLVDKTAAEVDRVLAVKLAGLDALLSALDTRRLHHIVLFASAAGFFGNRGQADYAMANAALNGVATALKRAHPAARVTAMNWGAWDGGMVTADLARRFADRGVPTLPVTTGVRLLVEQFDQARGNDVVCVLAPGRGTTVHRRLSGLADDPVVADHRIKDRPVLPVTVALGAMLNAARSEPVDAPATVYDITVYKGVVFDKQAPDELVFAVTEHPQGTLVDVTDDRRRPRYRAVVGPGRPAAAAAHRPVPAVDQGQPFDPYADGALFHGPRLRGMRRLLAEDDHGLTVLCRLDDAVVGDGGWETPAYRPVLADLLLQAPTVWMHRRHAIRALPNRIGEMRVHRPLPDDQPFVVSVHDVERTAAGMRCAVTAVDAGGAVLVEMRGVDMVARDEPVLWTREDLVTFARGQVADVFGPAFTEVDALPRRLRLPAPPYLMVSRVVAMQATHSRFEPSSITVEYDVPADSWFTVDGRLSFGPTLEIGQGSILLLSYLGIDLHHRGQRVYRLLGGSSIFHADLPRAGETLRLHIAVHRFVWQGDKLLFFFSCRGYRAGTLFVEMPDGAAGFFTDAEITAPGGVVPAGIEHRRPGPTPRDRIKPLAHTERDSLSRADLERLAEGRLDAVFGAAWDQGCNRSIRLPAGDLLVLDTVETIDRRGGVHGLGRLVATQQVDPDAWYFRGHFPCDPVMPGTVLVEGAAQLLQVYAMRMGLHMVLPDAEFQPVTGLRTHCAMRGQVTPDASLLRYEAEVTEVTLLPRPTIVADVVVYRDDLPVLSLRDLGVRVQEKPGTPGPMERGGRPSAFLGRRNGAGEPAVVNELHMAHLARGDLGFAMGPEFDIYRDRVVARIPNGDYQLIDRFMRVDGERGQRSGARTVSEYDVPPDAWYLVDGSSGEMPFGVLTECALQAAALTGYYLGGTLLTPQEDLVIRNLDGEGTLLSTVDLRGRTIRQESELLSTHQADGATLQSFRYSLAVDGTRFYQGQALFGYFNQATLARQVGLDGGARSPTWLDTVPGMRAETVVVAGDDRWFTAAGPGAGLRLAGGHLRLVDHVDVVPGGGARGLGYARAHRHITAGDWFFPCHFHGDPVMPGSLCIEMAVQTLQVYVVRSGLATTTGSARFRGPVGAPFVWKYRGQILPVDADLSLEVHLTEVSAGRAGLLVVADAHARLDGKRIYEFTGVAVAVADGTR